MGVAALVKKPWHGLRRAGIYKREAAGDRQYGIDTVIEKFQTPHTPGSQNHPYEPMHYEALDVVSRRLFLNASDVLYDLGCGKGRITCYFATKAIKKAGGVEYDPALAEAARANAANLIGRRAPISILTGDAAEQDYTDATVIFMFSPFGPAVMRRVLDRLKGMEGLRIVYASPSALEVFDEYPALKLIDDYYIPYDLGRAAVKVFHHT